jgi:hypothetical protein
MSIATIEQRVALWNLAKPVRINTEALADFKAEPSRTPADYIKAGLKGTSVWGAIWAAYYTHTSDVVVSSKSYMAIGENYHLITNHKDKDTMSAHLGEVLAGVKAEEVSQDDKDNQSGKAIADSMSAMLKVAKKSAALRAMPTDENIKAATELLAFATANLARFNLAVEVKAGKTTRTKTSK